jgi:hypothetical protein
MPTVQQKAQTVLRRAKFESIIRVQSEFRCEYEVRPHDDRSIRRWYEQFRENGSVEKKGILLDVLGDLMKMWIVSGRLSHESQDVDLRSKGSVTDAANDCPVFFGRA